MKDCSKKSLLYDGINNGLYNHYVNFHINKITGIDLFIVITVYQLIYSLFQPFLFFLIFLKLRAIQKSINSKLVIFFHGKDVIKLVVQLIKSNMYILSNSWYIISPNKLLSLAVHLNAFPGGNFFNEINFLVDLEKENHWLYI